MQNNNTRSFPVRVLRLIFGLFLYAMGCCLTIRANIGLSPWEAFSVGLAARTGWSVGFATVATGVAILGLVLLFKEKIGVGTILNTLLIGTFIDLILMLNMIPLLENFLAGTAMLLAGQFVICVGSYFYIGAGLGCGPRDSLMVALGKRLPAVPIGAVRGGIEAAVLAAGWLMGAKVGVGTVISVFGIGFLLQFTLKIFRFDLKAVSHESVIDTAKNLKKIKASDREQ